MIYIQLLLLLVVANGAPIIAHNLLGDRFNTPADLGAIWKRDGRPIFGPSKTIRGIVAAMLLTPIIAHLIGLGWFVGLFMALYAMLGDLLSSFIKRRANIASSDMALGLDQVPESLLPLLVVMSHVEINLLEVILLVAAFVAIEINLSRLLFQLHIRKRPY